VQRITSSPAGVLGGFTLHLNPLDHLAKAECAAMTTVHDATTSPNDHPNTHPERASAKLPSNVDENQGDDRDGLRRKLVDEIVKYLIEMQKVSAAREGRDDLYSHINDRTWKQRDYFANRGGTCLDFGKRARMILHWIAGTRPTTSLKINTDRDFVFANILYGTGFAMDPLPYSIGENYCKSDIKAFWLDKLALRNDAQMAVVVLGLIKRLELEANDGPKNVDQ